MTSCEESTNKFLDKVKIKENSSVGILKQSQNGKQKKKLEKKAAAVNKYISFFQQTKNQTNLDVSSSHLSSCCFEEEEEKGLDQFSTVEENKDGFKRKEERGK